MQRARFLNKEEVIKKLSALALKARASDKNIKQIILFGSIATDQYTGISDADILIVLKDSRHKRFIDRIPQYLPLFLDVEVPVDVFPYLESEIDNIPLAKRALSEGVVL